MVKVIIGDLFNSKAQTLVNAVNCVGVMGKGIALEFKKRFPAMYRDYVSLCKMGAVEPGHPYIFNISPDKQIINFPTKNHWREPSKIEYIDTGLRLLVKKYKNWKVKSLAVPALGCGNGGLQWADVGPLLYEYLSKMDMPVELYAPKEII